jgi:hypothetical protein
MGHAVFILGMLVFVGVAACHHFGWEGLAVPCAIWLLMPQLRLS